MSEQLCKYKNNGLNLMILKNTMYISTIPLEKEKDTSHTIAHLKLFMHAFCHTRLKVPGPSYLNPVYKYLTYYLKVNLKKC